MRAVLCLLLEARSHDGYYSIKALDVLLGVSCFWSIALGVCLPLQTLALGSVFEAFVADSGSGFYASISVVLSQFALLAAFASLAAFANRSCWNLLGERLKRVVMAALLKSILRESSKKLSRADDQPMTFPMLASDINSLELTLCEQVPKLIINITNFVVCLAIALWRSAAMTGVVCSTFPIVFIVTALLSKRKTFLSEMYQTQQVQIRRSLEQLFNILPTLQSFSVEDHEQKRLEERVGSAGVYRRRADVLQSVEIAVGNFFLLATFSLGFWFGSLNVMQGRMSSGDVLTVFYACLFGLQALQLCQPCNAALSGTDVSCNIIIDKLRNSRATSASAWSQDNASDIGEQVHGTFRLCKAGVMVQSGSEPMEYSPAKSTRYAIRDVTCTLNRTGLTLIVGESGAGKTTILRLLNGSLVPTEGKVLLDGYPIEQYGSVRLRKAIAVVPHQPVIFHDTILQNVGYGAMKPTRIDKKVVKRACRLAAIDDWIEQLPSQYDTIIGGAMCPLSGGQRQRIALARAYLHTGNIMLLDEPTSALNSELDHAIWRNLAAYRRGKITIAVSHRLYHATKVADSILVLEHGKLKRQLISLVDGGGYYGSLPSKVYVDKATLEEVTLSELLHERTLCTHLRLEEPVKMPSNIGNYMKAQDSVYRDSSTESLQPLQAAHSKISLHWQLATVDLGRRIRAVLRRDSFAQFKSTSYEMAELTEVLVAKKTSQGRSVRSASRLNVLTLLLENTPRRAIYLAGMAFTVAFSFVMPLFSLCLANLLTSYGNRGQRQFMDDIGRDCLQIIALAIAHGIFSGLAQLCFSLSCLDVSTSLKGKLLGKLLRRPLNGQDNKETMTRVLEIWSNDSETYSKFMTKSVGDILASVLTVLVGFTYALAIGWKLTLISLAVVTVTLLLIAAGNAMVRKWERVYMKAYDHCSEWIDEIDRTQSAIVALCLEETFTEKFRLSLLQVKRAGIGRSVVHGIQAGVVEALAYFCKIAIFWAGALLMADGQYDLAHMSSVWTVTIFCMTLAIGTLSKVPLRPSIFLTSERLLKVINRAQISQSTYTAEHRCSLASAHSDICFAFHGVSFAYADRPNHWVLRNVDLKVRNGEFVAIIGQSGSGKSTLIYLLERFCEPQRGHIEWGGRDIAEWSVEDWRRHIGLVQQRVELFEGTIADNIRWGKLDADMKEIITAAKHACIHDTIMTFTRGYDTVVCHDSSNLSSGYKQRIGLARAYLRQPSLLILDEATSALDEITQKKVMRGLQAFRKATNATVLMVTHRLETVGNADRVYRMDNGVLL